MSETTHARAGHVLAATDGSPAGTAVVEYAAHEAERLGVGLDVVHVMPAYLPTGPMPVVPHETFQENASDILKRALHAARRVSPGLDVSGWAVTGGRVASIAEAARDARLLVVGSHESGFVKGVHTGTVVAGVTARAACPVVVLPHHAGPAATVHGRVTVGVKDPERADRLLAHAFAEADSRGARLLVLHAWQLSYGYDDLVSNQVDREVMAKEIGTQIEDAIAHLRTAHPGVAVELGVVHGQPAYTLVTASKACDRLLISRPRHLGYFHHLGTTARAVLREAVCPVEVVPSRPDEATGTGE